MRPRIHGLLFLNVNRFDFDESVCCTETCQGPPALLLCSPNLAWPHVWYHMTCFYLLSISFSQFHFSGHWVGKNWGRVQRLLGGWGEGWANAQPLACHRFLCQQTLSMSVCRSDSKTACHGQCMLASSSHPSATARDVAVLACCSGSGQSIRLQCLCCCAPSSTCSYCLCF